MTYYMLLFTFYRNIAFITAFEHMRPLTELKNLKIKYSSMIFIWSLMTGNMMQPSEAWQHHKAHKKRFWSRVLYCEAQIEFFKSRHSHHTECCYSSREVICNNTLFFCFVSLMLLHWQLFLFVIIICLQLRKNVMKNVLFVCLYPYFNFCTER